MVCGEPIDLRPAGLQDAALLLLWRNDPLTRRFSINDAVVGWDEHIAWLEASLAMETRQLLVAVRGRPVGLVRIDRDEATEMSWTVAPDARGQGVGRSMLAAALPIRGRIVARIKSDNVASRRLASRVGFALLEPGPLERWELVRPIPDQPPASSPSG